MRRYFSSSTPQRIPKRREWNSCNYTNYCSFGYSSQASLQGTSEVIKMHFSTQSHLLLPGHQLVATGTISGFAFPFDVMGMA